MKIEETVVVHGVTEEWFTALVRSLFARIEGMRFGLGGTLIPESIGADRTVPLRLVQGRHLTTDARYEHTHSYELDGKTITDMTATEILEWSLHHARTQSVRGNDRTTVDVNRDGRLGLSGAIITGAMRDTGGKRATPWSLSLHPQELFDGLTEETTALAAVFSLQNAFVVLNGDITVTSVRTGWQCEINGVLEGRGLLKPIAAVGLALFGRRLKRAVTDGLVTAGTEWSDRIESLSRQSPDEASRLVLQDALAAK